MNNLYQHEVKSNRAAQIRLFCAEHGITTLVHFTLLENLCNILRKGLLSRSLLEKSGEYYLFCDQYRSDGHKDAVCLSISVPNYKMFRSKRKWNKIPSAEWVVLLLDAEVLSNFDCAFCQENAASAPMRCVPLEDKKSLNTLKDMFAEHYIDTKGDMYERVSLAKNRPTHPQAEVFVFDQIPPKYIKAVHFWDLSARRQWQSNNHSAYPQVFSVNQQYF